MAAVKTYPNAAHFDGNQTPTIMGVIGTLGTADTRGTALPLPVGVRAATGALMVHISGTDVDVSGAASGTNVNIVTGTQQTLGTVGVINSGSIVVTNGTVGIGSITDLALLGTVKNLDKGTITSVQGGTINVVAAGSHVHTAGTLTTGTLQNLVSGTINTGSVVVNSGTIGSVTALATLGTILNLNTGTIAVVAAGSHVHTAGTVTTMLAGTLTALANGTITAGTVRINHRNTNIGSTFGTLAVAAGSAFGTLVPASGAGTAIVVTGLSIVSVSGTPDVRILVGTAITGASVLAGGALVAGAGISMPFPVPHETATNQEITYHFVGAGTAFITLKYYNII